MKKRSMTCPSDRTKATAERCCSFMRKKKSMPSSAGSFRV